MTEKEITIITPLDDAMVLLGFLSWAIGLMRSAVDNNDISIEVSLSAVERSYQNIFKQIIDQSGGGDITNAIDNITSV